MTAKEIRRALDVLAEPDGIVEVRAFTRDGSTYSGYFKDLDLCAEVVADFDQIGGMEGIYLVLNAIPPELYAKRPDKLERLGRGATTTADAAITRRRWMLVDVDVTHPPGVSGIMANADEKSHALVVADRIADELGEAGWPAPVRGDSGNGGHLLYRVDLPSTGPQDTATDLVKRCLKTLAMRYDDEGAHVDQGVFNAARISKLFGTTVRKGSDTAERPYRRAALRMVPDPLMPVPVELLQALADEAGEPSPAISPQTATPDVGVIPGKTSGRGLDLRAWIEKFAAALAEKEIVVREKTAQGHLYFGEFEKCPFSADGAHEDGACIGQLDNGKIYATCKHNSCRELTEKGKGWGIIRDLVDQKGKKAKGVRDGDPLKRTLSFFEKEGRQYIVAMTENDDFGFVHLDDSGQIQFDATVTLENGTMIEPRRLEIHQDSGELMRVVGIPRVDVMRTVPLLSAAELFLTLNKHIEQYVDMPRIEREIGVYYAMFTWYYTKRVTSPYLRYIGDTGTGKSRTARVIADLCFLPILLTAGTSPSALMRQHEKWRGTPLIEEADMKGDMSDPVIKWLNAGFERDLWIMLSDKNDPNKQQAFQPWGPKVLAMRALFKDNATEARCLSYSPHETRRKDIPAELPKRYNDAVVRLRAMIARFVLAHWQEFNPDWVVTVEGVEPRLRQMSEPISCVLQFFPDGKERYRDYVTARQKAIRRTRAESKEGSFFNEALSQALGEGEDGPVELVTPRAVADVFKTTSTAVTATLRPIGFEIERERITVSTDNGEVRVKQVRKLVVPTASKYREITSRYYFDEDGKEAPECPEALRGLRWWRELDTPPESPTTPKDPKPDCPEGVSQVSRVSQAAESTGDPVTLVTLVTPREHGDISPPSVGLSDQQDRDPVFAGEMP